MTRRAVNVKRLVEPCRARRDYARWRVTTLLLVYVLMAAYVMHWAVTAKTRASLELSEVMYTFESVLDQA